VDLHAECLWPLFTFISAAFASASIAASEFAFKLIAAAASAGTLYLIWQSARRRGLNPARGIALFGLNRWSRSSSRRRHNDC